MAAGVGHSVARAIARRVCAYGLVAALALCTLLELELWPLSSFRLFSSTRSGTQISWELVRIDDGAESPLRLSALGRGYRHSAHYLPDLAAGGPPDRAAACAAWLGASKADEIRVYRSLYQRQRPGETREVVSHELRFRCTP